MKANEFLEYAGTNYESLKKKWSARLKKQGLQFSEDIYQNTILNVYDYLNKHEVEDNQIEGFWYKAFLLNTKREKEYAYNSKRDDDLDVIELLSDIPDDGKPILLDDIEGLKTLTPIELNLFLIYYLTDITYKELEEITDIKDVKYKLKCIVKKIKKKC